MHRLFYSTLVLLFCHSAAQAEYRAFLLEVRNEKKELIRTIPSNLDPEQYLTYHVLKPNEFLSYIDTWMCKGRTSDFEPICPNPKRQPASAEAAVVPVTDPSPQKLDQIAPKK